MRFGPRVKPQSLKDLVRSIPDFPKPGIVFRDVTTLICHGEGFAAAVEHLSEIVEQSEGHAVAGIEARGFIFGAAVAARLALPFIPIRKAGKLPVPTLAADYALEYGSDRLEIDPDAVSQGQSVTLIDDLIATGGTAGAAVDLIRRAGGVVERAVFVIDLPDLGGAARLAAKGFTVQALMAFSGN